MTTHQFRWFDSPAPVEEPRAVTEEQPVPDPRPSTLAMTPADIRAMQAKGLVHLPQAMAGSIPGRGNAIPIRTFRPQRIDGVYLHFHPGGWMFGGADHQDGRLWHLAERAHVAVVSVDYRLAPEHPFPAPVEDAEDALHWIVAAAADEFGTDKVILGGESAGAHLALLALLQLRDGANRPLDTTIRGVTFGYGSFDLSMTPSARQCDDVAAPISTQAMRRIIDAFVGAMDEEERRRPEVSPLYARLDGLPPAQFVVGADDPLLDDTLFMATRWRAAGNDTELAVFEGAGHGFTGEETPAATKANDLQIAHIRRCITSDDGADLSGGTAPR